ncbi:hypothetical protein [Hyphococcus sp.]|uniref:hypothetical protein n=1 Tax=Hyphococcus sp. TaxID=2038636 RepID=UPI003CCC1DB1
MKLEESRYPNDSSLSRLRKFVTRTLFGKKSHDDPDTQSYGPAQSDAEKQKDGTDSVN